LALGHPLLLFSIELLLEYRQQKEPERSQRGVGNCVTVPEQRILVKFVSAVQVIKAIRILWPLRGNIYPLETSQERARTENKQYYKAPRKEHTRGKSS
jgi:hypothetical protein